MADAPFARIRRQIDELAGRGRAVLRRWALNEAIGLAVPWLFPAAVPVPVVYLLASASGLAGAPVWPLGPWASAVFALAVPVAVCTFRTAWIYCTRQIDRRLALAMYDRALNAHDRIQAADEFLRSGTVSSFKLAAVADAQATVDRALATKLPPPAAAVPALQPGPWRWGAIAFAAFVLALLFASGEPVLDAGGNIEVADAVLPVNPQAGTQQTREATIRHGELERQTSPAQRMDAGEVNEVTNFSLQPRLNDERQPSSVGRAGGLSHEAGRNAADRAASSASGKSPSEPRTGAAERQDGRQPQSRRQSPPPPEEENESSSGIAAGMGGSSGSRISESDREAMDSNSDRDQTDDDVPDDAEEEEDEVQEAAAAMRPLLNQRKAPVDRSLSPSGAGEQQENPDANGRSGPGGLKKTRGVAAMLLGVPMPDQLLGHANPGRMKVQRERAEPQERVGAQYLAEERVAMDDGAGEIAREDFTLRMQNLIRDYFLARRQADNDPGLDPPTEATP